MKLIDIETGIENALAPLVTAGTIATLKILSENATDLWMHGAAGGWRAPFVAVLYLGGDMPEINTAAGLYLHRPKYQIYLGVSHLKSNASARSGLYEIMAAIMDALNEQDFSLEIEPVRFVGQVQIHEPKPNSAVILYSLRIETEFVWNIAEENT